MKLIIWWCALMIILPLLYLFWWKKEWRLLFGIIILVVLLISYWVPGEIAYSILTTETEKEKPFLQLETTLKNISDDKPNPDDPEKLKLEKSIIKSRKELAKLLEKNAKREKLNKEEISKLLEEILSSPLTKKQKEWVKKWGKKEKASTLLFCGEEFNEQLAREKQIGKDKFRAVENYNIIDFGQVENNKSDSFQKKLQEICQHEENYHGRVIGYSPIIWFKNIDKITNSKLKEELVKVVDPNQNDNLGKYQAEVKIGEKTEKIEEVIDLSQFTLVATTSTSNPQLSKELRDKLKHIEPFFDKYFWVLFCLSTGIEVIIFLLLMRWRKKQLQAKNLAH